MPNVVPVAPSEILELFKGGYLSIAETIEALYGGPVAVMPDAERQILVVLVTRALVEIRDDTDMEAAAKELTSILRKINGVDKKIEVHG